MIDMSQAGVATAVAAVAAVSVMGGAVGTPVAVDSFADQNPGSPLYVLERAGESIKEATYAGGREWNLSLAKERTSEYANVAKKKVTHDHINLLNEAGERFGKALKNAADNKGLQRVQGALRWQENRLEMIREKVHENARPAISLAISRSSRLRGVIKDVETGVVSLSGKAAKRAVRQRVKNVREELSQLKEQVKENQKRGRSSSEIVQNIEIRTARALSEKYSKMAKMGKAKQYEALLEEAENRIRTAARVARDNRGLERAIRASRKHLRVLENVYKEVPETAKPAIGRAMQNGLRNISVLENVRRRIGRGIGPENAGKAFENIRKRIGPPENAGPSENAGPPESPGKSKSFVHNRGNVPEWVPRPPPWVGSGGAPGRGPGFPDNEEDEQGDDSEETEVYSLLGGVKIQETPASYSVNPSNGEGIEDSNVVTEIAEAFETWDAKTSTELFQDSVSTTDKKGFERDNVNVVSFAPLEESGAAGKTRAWYDEESREVLEFDIVLNSEMDWGIDPDGDGPETISGFDIQNVATHEAGHTLVLQDIEDDSFGHLTMYHQSELGSVVKRTLENGDIAGLQELYGE